MAGAGGEALLEFQRVGNIVKVTAIDPVTLVEVTIQGPASLPQQALARTAVAKLNYVIAKKQGRPPA
ncbi:MAG TPA: hypothetical protein VEB20_03380 [Azospirillaceae bacterium]|nr:hypothetical protein [Azospirillaceae bacterium]